MKAYGIIPLLTPVKSCWTIPLRLVIAKLQLALIDKYLQNLVTPLIWWERRGVKGFKDLNPTVNLRDCPAKSRRIKEVPIDKYYFGV
jgi:hypothetical protein